MAESERGISLKKLQTRMLLFILVPTLIFFVAMIVYVSYTVNDIAKRDAEEMLEAHGEALSNELRIELEAALSSVQTLSGSFEGIIERASTPRRENANVMLQQLLENNPHAVTAWMFWEENAFDGKDEEYVDTPGHDGTGRFIPVWSQGESGDFVVEPVLDYDKPGDVQENLNNVLKTGKDAIFEPFTYEIGGQTALITSIVSPVTVDGETIGMTGVDILLDRLDDRISKFSFYESGFAGLMSNSGNVLSHQNTALIGENYFESEAMERHPDLDSVMKAVKTGDQIKIEGHSNALKKDVYRLFTPLTIGTIETPWSSFIAAPIDEVTDEARKLTAFIISVSSVVLLTLAIIILIVTRNIVQPIRATVAHGKEMAAGDFTRHVPEQYLKRKDETGDLARIFSSISENMRAIISQVQESTRMLVQSADVVDAGATQASSAANEVASSIAEVAHSAENQMQSAEESAKSMEDMTQGVQRVADTASDVSEAANDMADRAMTGQKAVQTAAEQMSRIQSETNETKSVIGQLQDGANKIESIVTVITDISEQTNLLALNAAIEAARAGEAGKGFAVVAEEVRKLADGTKESAMDIQQLVAAIQSDTAEATRSMNANEHEVNQGIEHIEHVGRVFENILTAVQQVVHGVEELSAVSEQMSAVSEQIAAASEEIASSAEDSSGHSQQVAAAAQQQLASMEEMTKTSQSLKVLANELNDILKQFKVS